MEAPPKGPFVQVAAFCDRVLEDKDGTLSLIRIIDQVHHQVMGPDAPRDMPPFQYELAGVVCLKPGDALGRMNFEIVMERPDGTRKMGGSGSIHFPGGANNGVNVPLRLNVMFEQEGLYWFDIVMEEQLLTRMPVMVNYSRLTVGPSQPS
ncbi:MAG: hypothetical protein HY874_09360 [Chloroflexi bacterium]|nr:hypothetical protein [Chloroflexota bacterium]